MKRVLVVSYYFPPSGGSGVQRPLKMVKYLREFGWEATVLTVDPAFASYSDVDDSMLDDIPDGIRVIRSRARDPYALYSRFTGRRKAESVGVGFTDSQTVGFREKVARWIRGNMFIPDARVGWVRFAFKAALKEISERPYDAVLTTGPPHSTHLIGVRIKKETGLPWIIDLRDAWPSDSYGHLIPMTNVAVSWDQRLRSKAYQLADSIICVSKSIQQSTSMLTDTSVKLVPNGYDEDDFIAGDHGSESPIPGTGFSIVFTGHMPDEQNPDVLWEVIKAEKEADRWDRLHIYLVGNVSRATLESLRHHNLENVVSIVPYVRHSEAVAWMCYADLLLLTINRVPNPNGIITGKLYEYLASGKPVICLGPIEGDAAELISMTEAGVTVDHGDAKGLRSAINEQYEAWNSGSPMAGASASAAKTYSRRVQVENLAELLTEISG